MEVIKVLESLLLEEEDGAVGAAETVEDPL